MTEEKKISWSEKLQNALGSAIEASEKLSVEAGKRIFAPVTKDKDDRQVWTGMINEVSQIRDEVAPKLVREDKKGRITPIVPTPVPVISKEAAVLRFLKVVFKFLFGIKNKEE